MLSVKVEYIRVYPDGKRGLAYETVENVGELKIAATLKIHLPAATERFFDYVAAEGVLPEVLTGHGLVPVFVRTWGNTGPWDQPGFSCTVHPAGGSTSHGEVTAYDRPRYFAYRTSDYTFALKYLADFAEGQWWFASDQSGTLVRWTDTFHAKFPLTAIPVQVFIRSQWLGYMRVCSRNTERRFSSENRAPATMPAAHGLPRAVVAITGVATAGYFFWRRAHRG